MFRTALWTLRQPRYVRLAAAMLVIALICIGAGTWQISRFEQKVHDNDRLEGNAHAAARPLSATIVPLVGNGGAPGRDAIRFRTVTASGSYVAGVQEFVRNQSLNGTSGYYVLNAFRTATGVLLVVRGFVAEQADGGGPPAVESPPAGSVHIRGRLQTAGTKDDAVGTLGRSEIESVNPMQQAARLGAPVYDAYVTLNGHQAGSAGVRPLPPPDLSNPAGGAVDAQHFAYIVQWYLFALLALAAPFAISRSEVRDARQRFLGLDPGNAEFAVGPGGDGDPQLGLTAADPGTSLTTRSSGTIERRTGRSSEEWQRAAHLADRYGRSLGPDGGAAADQASRAVPVRSAQPVERSVADPDSDSRPHRSHDAYQGSYNDYLWQLALADGTTPVVPVAPIDGSDAPRPAIIEGSAAAELPPADQS